MHRYAITTLIVAAAWGIVPGHALAQATARTTVTVRIPTVLRLRIDQATNRDAHSVDFQISDGKVDPGGLDVEVFANTAWTLTVEDRGGDGPSLQYERAGTGHWLAPESQPEIDSGGPTGGWQRVPLEFRADPSEALVRPNGHRTLLFTLTRP
ncbi:MAG: hypothetical protein P8Y02_01395 [Deinococcales bacterium]